MPNYGDSDHRSFERGSDEEFAVRVERAHNLRSRIEKTVLWPMTGAELVALNKTMGLVHGPMGRVLPTDEEMDVLENYLANNTQVSTSVSGFVDAFGKFCSLFRTYLEEHKNKTG